MTNIRQLALSILVFLFGTLLPAGAVTQEDFSNKTVVIEVGENTLGNKQSFQHIKRIIDRAKETNAAAIVFELNTPGGLAWETSELMKDLQPVKIPTYAFVNTKAISAGALLAMSCDTIYMAPGSSIGAAAVVNSTGEEMDPMMRKKADSAFSAIVRSAVEQKGHNVDIAKSMMIASDEEKTFGSVKLPKGELLSLSAKEAVSLDENGKPILAKAIVPSVNDLLAAEQITAPVAVANPTVFEKIAIWIDIISPFLILIGIGGIYLEFKTPGFGIGGIIAIVAFSLFFFGNNIAGNLAGYEMAALFVLGICLIIAEIFFIPGTFIAGIAGVVLVIVSLFGGMIGESDLNYIMTNNDWSLGALMALGVRPLFLLSLGLFGSAILILVLMKYLPETSIFRKFANDVISGGQYEGEEAAVATPLAMGAYGEAITELKPSGKAIFNGETYEVFSRMGILPKGTPLRVIEKRSFDFVVEKAETAPASKPEATAAADEKNED